MPVPIPIGELTLTKDLPRARKCAMYFLCALFLLYLIITL